MYNAFFGFSESPFSLSPDPAFFYRSEQHEEALANLVYGVQARKGFIVLSGEVGTGKTTMLECLRDYLDANFIEFAFLFNSRINVEQFFEMIAYDLDLPCARTSKTEVLFALNTLLVEQAQDGKTVVLIVDEAHNLEWEVLEEIRLLGNLENRQREAAANRPGGAARAGPQTGCSESPAVEAARGAALQPDAVRAARSGGIYRFAAGAGRDAGSDRCFPKS